MYQPIFSPSCALLLAAMLATLPGCSDDGGSQSASTSAGSATSSATSGGPGGGTTNGASNSGTTRNAGPTTGDSGVETGPDPTESSGEPLENFSFFLTSLAGLQELAASELGFGSNLSYDGEVGIAGSDRICEALAEMSMPGSAVKQWRAMLSTTSEDGVDRIGQGPWYDRNGRELAPDLDALMNGSRPDGDKALVADLTNEWGVQNSAPDGESLDNHDTMTGSDENGRLLVGGGGAGFSTCEDWTSAASGQPPPAMGHSWRAMSGTSWQFVGSHATGCEPLVWLVQTGPNCRGQFGVGCDGGYGGFYCLALNP